MVNHFGHPTISIVMMCYYWSAVINFSDFHSVHWFFLWFFQPWVPWGYLGDMTLMTMMTLMALITMITLITLMTLMDQKKIMDWRGHSGTTLSSSFVFLLFFLFLLSCRDFIRMILTPMLGRVRISVHHSHLMKLNIAFNDWQYVLSKMWSLLWWIWWLQSNLKAPAGASKHEMVLKENLTVFCAQ